MGNVRDRGQEVLDTQVWDDEDGYITLFCGGLCGTFGRAGRSLADRGHCCKRLDDLWPGTVYSGEKEKDVLIRSAKGNGRPKKRAKSTDSFPLPKLFGEGWQIIPIRKPARPIPRTPNHLNLDKDPRCPDVDHDAHSMVSSTTRTPAPTSFLVFNYLRTARLERISGHTSSDGRNAESYCRTSWQQRDV